MLNGLSAWINSLAPPLIAALTAAWLIRILRWRLAVGKTPTAAPIWARLWSWASFQILKPLAGGRRGRAFFFHLGLAALLIKHFIFLAGYPWPWWVWRAAFFLSPLFYLWLIMLMFMMARRLWPHPPLTPGWPLSNWLTVILLALAASSGFLLAHNQSGPLAFPAWSEGFEARRAFFQKTPSGWLSLHLALVSGLLTAWLAAPLSRHPWHK